MDSGPPVGGRHYPRGFRQFEGWFDGEPAARTYLEAVRFRNGHACPKCGAMRLRRHAATWWCPDCRRSVTVTVGTLLEHTRIPLRTWMGACWHLTSTKVGVSAMSLEHLMDIDYMTAWSMLHKLRAAMDQAGRDRLTGEVEIDETFVGGREIGENKGRSRGKKQVVIVACERVTPTAMGRIRLGRLPDASGLSLRRFIEANVEPGTVVVTDAWGWLPGRLRAPRRRRAPLHAQGHQPERHHRRRPHRLPARAPSRRPPQALAARNPPRLRRGGPPRRLPPRLLRMRPTSDGCVFRFNRRTSSKGGLLF